MHYYYYLHHLSEDHQKTPKRHRGSTSHSVIQQPSTSTADLSQSSGHQYSECLQAPCIVEQPPPFLRGSGIADIGNVHKRYKLYKKCWSYLQKQGLWHNPQYIQRKIAYTTIDDSREIMPWCICQVYQYVLTLWYVYIMQYLCLHVYRKYVATLTLQQYHTSITRPH